MRGKKTAKEAAEAAAPPSVDQIRDIIFGSQMQEYEKRFLALEQRLLKESKALRDELRDSFKALEKRQEEERDLREAASSDFQKTFEDKVAELVEHAARDRESLEQALASARDDITSRLDELNRAKTDRQALSTLLKDVASELENGSSPAARKRRG